MDDVHTRRNGVAPTLTLTLTTNDWLWHSAWTPSRPARRKSRLHRLGSSGLAFSQFWPGLAFEAGFGFIRTDGREDEVDELGFDRRDEIDEVERTRRTDMTTTTTLWIDDAGTGRW